MHLDESKPRPTRKSVLIIDDDDDIRETLAALLHYEGYEVHGCENGRDALQRLRSGAPSDVILLDLMMPVMDGWQFRVEQKRDPGLATIPVIAVSADSTAKAAAIDADAYITKPVDANALLATLDRLFLARERAQLEARLGEAERLSSLGTVAASVAHEINHPLAYVVANLELVDGHLCRAPGPGNAEARAALAEAREGLERIRTIVRDLRTFSHPSNEGRAPVDLGRVLDSCANIVNSEVKHRARLVKEYAEAPRVVANEARLGQVFLNLIVNAAQAIPEGHADEHEIRLIVRPGAAGSVVVEVRDTGEGIPPELRSRIFEPFFTTKPIGMGTGIGLSICRRIITGLGGTLTVESTLGKGSTFRVELPGAAGEVELAPRGTPEPTPSKRGRVLIVDDEAPLCLILRRLLGDTHDVTTLTSAREAAARITKGERYDVILSDLMMPGMSGMDLHAELSRVAPDQATRMVFITGGAFTPRATAFIASVPNRFIEKPFDAKMLLSLLRELLG